MPAWLIAALVTAAALLVAWWAETRAATIIADLKAIRGSLKAIRANLENLGTESTTENEDTGESSERVSELPGQTESR